MALGFPVHAAQITQFNQAEQAELNQQVKQIQTETNLRCIRLSNGKFFCR